MTIGVVSNRKNICSAHLSMWNLFNFTVFTMPHAKVLIPDREKVNAHNKIRRYARMVALLKKTREAILRNDRDHVDVDWSQDQGYGDWSTLSSFPMVIFYLHADICGHRVESRSRGFSRIVKLISEDPRKRREATNLRQTLRNDKR